MTDQIVTDTAASLRAAADFIEANPQLPVPYATSHPAGTVHLNWYLDLGHHELSIDDQVTAALTVFDAVGGMWTHTAVVREDRALASATTSRDRLVFHVQTARLELAETPC